MSIFSSIGKVAGGIVHSAQKVLKGAGPVLGGPVGTAIGGPLGGVIGGVIGGQMGGGGGLPAIPGGSMSKGMTGRAVHAGGTLRPVYNKQGQLVDYRATRHRRGRGFSARDIRQTRRMLALVRDVERSCPKHRTSRTPARTCR